MIKPEKYWVMRLGYLACAMAKMLTNPVMWDK